LGAKLYLRCEPAVARTSLHRQFADEASQIEINACLDGMIADHLLLEIDGKLLALAVEGDCPSYCDPEDFPGGNGQRLEPFTTETLEAFCESAKTLAARNQG